MMFARCLCCSSSFLLELIRILNKHLRFLLEIAQFLAHFQSRFQGGQMRRNLQSFDKLSGTRQDGTSRPANSTFRETAATILRDKIYSRVETIDRLHRSLGGATEIRGLTLSALFSLSLSHGFQRLHECMQFAQRQAYYVAFEIMRLCDVQKKI